MCRIGVYRGRAITLKKFIFDQPHNFVEQARQPKEMVITPINVDGYGLAWYNLALHTEPAIIKSEKPFWHDVNVASISDKIMSQTIFMHIRAASPGLPVHQANAHPFSWKNQMMMHNGIVSDFKKGYMRSIRQMISDEFYSHLQGNTDSEHIFNLYLTIRAEQPKLSMKDAVLELFSRLNSLAQKHNSDLILNLAFTDGRTTVATCYSNIDKQATLYYTDSSKSFPEAVLISSEPLDYNDKSWKKFPMNHLMEIDESAEYSFTEIPNPFYTNGVAPPAKPVTLRLTLPIEE
jgi:glutamine amidotransferase